MENNQTPILIANVKNQPFLSMARNFGGITLKGKRYIYMPPYDALLRNDWVKKYAEHNKQGKDWQSFIDIVSQA